MYDKIKITVFALFVIIFSAAGCRSKPPVQSNVEVLSVLGRGDVVEIMFINSPQFNTKQAVRPDGVILLPLIGEVTVEGKTIPDLTQELTRLYTNQLKYPELVVSLSARRVYVGGEVQKPGAIDVQGRVTALDAIMQAGGFLTQTAALNNVIIIRHEGDERYGCSIDVSNTFKGKSEKQFYLKPNDIVYVPRTTIVKVNAWVDQYIEQIIPQVGFLYTSQHRTTNATRTLGYDTSN